MYEVIESTRRTPEGREIRTFIRDVVSCNILEVEAGTTGYKGGDSAYGCATYFRIQDEACTDITVNPLGYRGDEGFEVVLGGDTELSTIITALKFIVKVLEEESQGVNT